MRHKTLSNFIDSLQSKGRYTFTKSEAKKRLGVSKIALKNSLIRLARKKRIVMLRRGFFVIVPLEYRISGIIPATWYIRDLAKFIKCRYYTGLLSAASLHSASHQQPQEFHVVIDRQERNIAKAGQVIRFFSKKEFEKTAVQQVKTETGYILVSTPGATAIDLIHHENSIGGLDRVLTVLQELTEKIKPNELINAAKTEKTLSYIQRLGYLLGKAGKSSLADKLADWIAAHHIRLTPLKPSLPRKGFPRNKRWNVITNTEIEGEL